MLVEDNQRLSRSLLWRLQRAYFERAGLGAWSDGTVPHYITSNPFIADAYAQVVFGFLRDAAPFDTRQPIYLVELGAGSGRFAFYFLQRFAGVRAGLPFTYVMTDFAEGTLAAWRAHPRLRPFLDEGVLDFARFDVGDRELRLERAGTVLRAGELGNPLVVLANYYFDGLPVDAFHVLDGGLYESLVSLSSKQEEPDHADPGMLPRLSLSYVDRAAAPAYYDDPELDRILDGYRRRHADAAFSFPAAGIDCCRSLAALSSGRLLLVTGDKGTIREETLAGARAPGMAVHGSFSMNVNYHAVGEWFRARGGEVLHPAHRHASLSVAAFVLGGGEHPETRHAFAGAVEEFGPDDFFTLKKGVERSWAALSIAEVLALLRLGRGDPRTLRQAVPILKDLVPAATAGERADVHAAIERAWQLYYHIGEEYDFPFEVALLFFAMSEYRAAIVYFERSLAMYGADSGTFYNLGLCHFLLDENQTALGRTDEAIALDPAHAAAVALRADILKTL